MSRYPVGALRAKLTAWWHSLLRLVAGSARPSAAPPGKADCAAPASVPDPAREHFISVEDLQCLDNFYGLEHVPGIGHWRWSGPACSFSLFAPVAREADQIIAIEALGTPAPINWGNTFLEVEDEMFLCEHREVNGRHWLVAHLPARPQARGAFIRYHIQDSRCPPVNADGSRDGRKLGLSLTGLHVLSN